MTAQPEHVHDRPPAMRTIGELRTALAAMSGLGLPTYLDKFEAELSDTPLDQVPALADRYRAYVLRNTTPEAVAALTASARETHEILRQKIAESGAAR